MAELYAHKAGGKSMNWMWLALIAVVLLAIIIAVAR
jgi:hypothetical protein